MKLTLAVFSAALALPISFVQAQDQVLLENQSVRVIEATFKPGAKEAVHARSAGWYYVTKAGTLKASFTNGKVEMWKPKVGQQAWIDGEEPLTAENVGKTTLQYILVEIKGAQTKTQN